MRERYLRLVSLKDVLLMSHLCAANMPSMTFLAERRKLRRRGQGGDLGFIPLVALLGFYATVALILWRAQP